MQRSIWSNQKRVLFCPGDSRIPVLIAVFSLRRTGAEGGEINPNPPRLFVAGETV